MAPGVYRGPRVYRGPPEVYCGPCMKITRWNCYITYTDVICNEAVPFRPYCAGVATRTRNVSEYMLVLALPSLLSYYLIHSIIFVLNCSVHLHNTHTIAVIYT